MGGASEPEDKGFSDRFRRISELLAAIVLSIGALLSSYAGFQGELWDGEQAANYALAEQTRTNASRDEMVAVQFASMDAMLFTKWVDADSAGNQELARYYRARFRPEFKASFEQWLKTNPRSNPKAPATPFHTGNYFDQSRQEARDLERKADQFFKDGQRANEISDAYGQAVVIFALSLFMGGISQTFDTRRTRILLLALSMFCLLLGTVRILGEPAIRLY